MCCHRTDVGVVGAAVVPLVLAKPTGSAVDDGNDVDGEVMGVVKLMWMLGPDPRREGPEATKPEGRIMIRQRKGVNMGATRRMGEATKQRRPRNKRQTMWASRPQGATTLSLG